MLGHRCAVTGCAERLDVYSGLLPAAHLDGAFDACLIDLDDAGRIRFAEHFSPADRLAAGLHDTMALAKLTPDHGTFLAWRRAHRQTAGQAGPAQSMDRPNRSNTGLCWLRLRFVSASRPAKRKFETSVGRLVAIILIFIGNSNGYRMGQVNSHGETRASERDFDLPAPAQGAHPAAKNGRFPGLFRVDCWAERVSP